MMRRAAALVALVSVSFAGTRHAAAGGSPRPVRVLAPTCTVTLVEPKQYVAVLRVELEAAGFTLLDDPAGSPDEPTITVALEPLPCDAHAASVEVVVTNAGSRQTARREIPVWDLDATARPRAVALATAELLLRATWRAPEAAPPREPAEPTPAASTTTAPVAPASVAPIEPPAASTDVIARPLHAPPPLVDSALPPPAAYPVALPTLTVGGVFDYRSYLHAHTSLLGGRVVANRRLGDTPFELGVGVGARGGTTTDPLGTVDLFSTTVDTSLRYLLGSDHTLFTVGPSLEGGYGHVSGDPRNALSARGDAHGTFVLEGTLGAGLRLEWAKGWWFVAEGLGGYSISGLRGFADDRAVAGMNGPVGAMHIGALLAR